MKRSTPFEVPAEAGASRRKPGFARRFWPVWLAGLIGVMSLALQAPPAALVQAAPQFQALHPLAVRAVLLLNPLILLTVLVLIGAAVAHQIGLGSLLAGTAPMPASWWDWLRWPVGLGLALAALLTGLDLALAPSLGRAWQQLMSNAEAQPWWQALVLGVMYGGLAEEAMSRWGAMALFGWLLFASMGRLRRAPATGRADARESNELQLPASIAWVAITLAALLFAAGHLPALAQSIELTPPLVARTLGLNLLAGLAYGWLFWRRDLEAAMLAHAATHVGFALARALLA